MGQHFPCVFTPVESSLPTVGGGRRHYPYFIGEETGPER